MSNKKTLYILGAGASSEAGLPTGHKLKEATANLLDMQFNCGEQINGDEHIWEAIRIHVKQPDIQEQDLKPYLQAAWHIRDAMPQAISIDNFIDTHNDDKMIELCGKLAIVRSILDAERSSKLYIDPSNINNRLYFSALEETWYASYMKLLAENCTKKDLSKRLESIVLIVFNYDRCIDHFLYNSLKNYYGLQPEEVIDLVNEIEIYHPYGVVGNLPWQGGQSVAFGAEIDPYKLLDLAKQIKTFTEGTDPESSNIADIHDRVSRANPIVFLGFAYHKQNMELLWPKGRIFNTTEPRSCFGTAMGISEHDCERIKREMSPSYKRTMTALEIRNDLHCCDLFKEYRRSLSLN